LDKISNDIYTRITALAKSGRKLKRPLLIVSISFTTIILNKKEGLSMMDTSIKPTLFEAKTYQPLLESFGKITDLRCKRGVRYKLQPFLILLFLSKLGGADRPAEIADWVEFRFCQLKSLLNLDWKRSPHEVTWKRIIENAIDAEQVEKVFGEYLLSMSEDEQQLWNLDGKVVRGVTAAETPSQLHLLALHESQKNLAVEQTALEAGENEISAGKRLLGRACLQNKIISGDAMFAQQELSRKVVLGGGEYVWKLRANQGKIYELAKEYFEKKTDRYLGQSYDIDKGHGRIEERKILTSFRLAGEIEFPFLEQVFRIEKKSIEIKTGKQSEQTIYGITSLPVEEYGAADLLELTRKHWRVENGLHYRRDVTFKEDAVKKKSINGGQIMAVLNNLAIGVLRKIGWENIAKARRYYETQIKKGLELIYNPIVV
jgi:predicted transposase YbfD/YdcC